MKKIILISIVLILTITNIVLFRNYYKTKQHSCSLFSNDSNISIEEKHLYAIK
mgnify:CR=1 FL=1